MSNEKDELKIIDFEFQQEFRVYEFSIAKN